MEDKNSPPGASNSSDTAESPTAQSPSPPKANKSPPPASPPPPPPSSPPPVRSPPPSPPPPPPTSQSPPPPSSSPPPSSQSTPQSPPPPPNAQSPPTPSSNSPPPLSPPQSLSNSSPPPSQNNPSDPPPDDSINTSPPPALDNNNGKGNGNNNNNKQWNPPPPPPASSSNSSQNSNGSPALSPPSESSNGSPSNNNGSSSMLSIPVVAAVAAGVALLIIVMLLLFFACRKKTNRERNDKMPYYYNNHPTANNYYNNAATRPPQPLTNWQTDGGVSGGGGAPLYNNTAHGHNQNYNNMHANDDQLNALPPLPGGVPKVDWPTPPPPHRGAVPAVTNSDMSPASNSSPYGPVVPPPAAIPALGLSQSEFTYEELSAATGGFSQSSVLGKGGFGYVHKGTLPNGKEIAVKSLKPGSGQGEREFKAEVKIISRIHHRHLVSLVGYCIAVDKRLLVYEYVTNNNLEYHLHGKGQPVMDWSTRLKIALGSAKGLAYLHEDCHPRIIHRDIKSSNILLDFTWEAKVGDFGLAKLNADNNTHVSTRVMGTFGYLAPEYASSGKLTEKSDVFSFGVMLLELITGRRPVDPTRAMEDTLVDWARPLCLRALEDGNFDELADPYLEKNYQVEEMARMVACAGASIRHSARRRPKVSQIVRALEGDMSLEDFNNGIKPSQASIFNGETTSSSKSYDLENSSYTEDLMKLRKMAGENTGGRYVSSEYGATSEYGLNPSSSSSEFESRDQSPRNNIKSSF